MSFASWQNTNKDRVNGKVVRLVGVEIPKNKRVVVALTFIYGIGKSLATKICQQVEIDSDTPVYKLSDSEVVNLQNVISQFSTEGAVRRSVNFNIKRLKEINCYRGIRHHLNLPVRGQITQKNARTRKGPKKTVANKKKVDAKT